ncbi:WD40 repeat domain-containing protein [Sporomusa sp.]|uniref:WD40 repeat domain-containing protein n=1 Tax=Sporomusa sp. TaxID=2078658 RepID=UPI002D11FAC6|nr:hypothetical protein [Sporomusa sp.]HWR44608.1 hypothetical protein [Sporomusa sp.]
MSRDPIGILLLKAGTFLYGVIVIYQIYAGIVHYLSVLALPVITALALWRPRIVGWIFLWVAFSFHFLYYALNFISLLAMYIGIGFIMEWWPGLKLPFLGDNALIWLVKVLIFLAAAIFVGANKQLFDTPDNQRPSHIRKACAILLAAILPFLPWIEQTAWNALDPRVLDNQTEIKGICFSPDGQKIGVINGGPDPINIWNVETKKFVSLRASHNEPTNSLAFSPDGKYVALGYGQAYGYRKYEARETVKIDLWELATGKRIELRRTEPVDLEKDSHRQVNRVAFSPNSAYLACSSGSDNEFIEIWDVGSGKLVKTFNTKGSVISYTPMAYSPDGKSVATKYAYGEIAIWDLETAAIARRLTEGYKGIIHEIAYSPDGRYLAAAFNKEWPGSKGGTAKGFIDIWDVAAGKIDKTLQWDSDNHIKGLSYSPDGKYIASFQLGDVVNIWDVAGSRQIDTLTGPVYEKPIASVAYSPDGRYLAIANGQYIKLYGMKKNGE